MFKRLKDILGIEGVHIELSLTEAPLRRSRKLSGEMTLSTQAPSTVNALEVWLVEQYTWGRGAERRIEHHTLATLHEAVSIPLERNEVLILPFQLTFAERPTAVDKLATRSIILKPVAQLARLTMGVRSKFFLHARVKVSGVALDPGAQLEVMF